MNLGNGIRLNTINGARELIFFIVFRELTGNVVRTPFRSAIRKLALFMLALPAFAEQDIPQGCIAELIDTAKSLPQPYAVRKNYCDGTVPVLNRAELQVVSLTAGSLNFSTRDHDLYVKPVFVAEGSVHLLGIDKRSSGSYRLDALLPPAGLHVDLDSAVHPKGLTSEFLGLVAWQDVDGQKRFIPVQATPSRYDPKIFTLQLRTPTPVVEAAYELCDGEKCDKQKIFGRDLAAGSLLNVNLNEESSSGVWTVKITVMAPAKRVYGQILRIGTPK